MTPMGWCVTAAVAEKLIGLTITSLQQTICLPYRAVKHYA